jgi:hypothetical protein
MAGWRTGQAVGADRAIRESGRRLKPFHILFIIGAQVVKWQGLSDDFDADGPIEDEHFQAEIAVDAFDLLLTAVDREVV